MFLSTEIEITQFPGGLRYKFSSKFLPFEY